MWEFIQSHWRDGFEILVLAFCMYQLYRAFRATRGAQILIGLGSIMVALALLTQVFQFEVIGWLITRSAAVIAFALLVIFQPELRNALARLGSSQFFSFSSKRRLALVERLADSVVMLSKKRVGALFAIQRDITLKEQLETGVILDAQFTSELAMSVFYPKSPLHDGGMIIADDRVAGAACVFPVTEKEMRDRSTGLRHRAAIGLTERTDAIAVVVSEETGSISICENGILQRNLTENQFREKISEIFFSSPISNDETESIEKLDSETDVPAAGGRDLVSDKDSSENLRG